MQLCREFEESADYQPRVYVDPGKWKVICDKAKDTFTFSEYWDRFLYHSHVIFLLLGSQLFELLILQVLHYFQVNKSYGDFARAWAPIFLSLFSRFAFWILLIVREIFARSEARNPKDFNI